MAGSMPCRGEIWLADLNPTVGHEQAGRRPVLIISTDLFNHGPAELVFVLPLTRTERGIPIHVSISPPEGGLRKRSLIMCDALRSVSKMRLVDKPWGRVSARTIKQVEDSLRILMDL
ncbi:MAG: type II toxin-antitoxin system PemK/MazF family toxin [Chloroflexi bacterium]|nr:type II toxin-antitoxin system PemK/MazF family toxin [Chloroflexota bacterium]